MQFSNPLQTVLISLVIAFSLGAGMLVISRLVRGERVIPFEPRQSVPWDLRYLSAVFVLFFFITPIIGVIVVHSHFGVSLGEQLPEDSAEVLTWSLASAAIGTLLSGALSVLLLKLGARASWFDLGLRANRVLSDIGLGVLAFVVVTPPVYLLHILLSLFYAKEHPIVEMISDHGTPGLWLWGTVATVIAAPLVEEIIFRLVLQGWLERRAIERLQAGRPQEEFQTAPDAAEEAEAPDVSSGEGAPESTENPYESPAVVTPNPVLEPDRVTIKDRLMIEPIAISSFVFAAVHFGHGAAPISLFFLAIALGYLYQRTHRILPCIIVHMLFNSVSMGLLWLESQ